MSVYKRQIRWWALLIVTAVALYLCWLMVKPFIGVLMWAAVLVIVFYPIHRRLVQRTNRPSLSALISCALVVLTILVPVALITIAVINELSGAVLNVQGAINYVLDPNSPLTGRLLGWASRYIDVERLRSGEYLGQQLSGISGGLAGRTLGVIGGLIGAIVQMFFVVFTMYYLFRDGDRIFVTIKNSLPLDEEQSLSIMERTKEVVGASVYGVLAISVIQGTL